MNLNLTQAQAAFLRDLLNDELGRLQDDAEQFGADNTADLDTAQAVRDQLDDLLQ